MERHTRQRDAVLGALAASKLCLSPAEILSLSRESLPSLGIATVYRQLKDLQETGAIQRVDLPGDAARYELTCTRAACRTHGASAHHHYFCCRECDRVFPIHGCKGHLDRGLPKGFRADHHELILHGNCADCAA